MGEQGFGLTQIGQISVPVRDVQRALAFYRDTLGMKLLFEAGSMAFFDCGGIRLMLGVPEKPELDHPASIIYYKVADIEKACATLRERGAPVEQDPQLVAPMEDHDLWMAFLRDPEDNILALMSEVARA